MYEYRGGEKYILPVEFNMKMKSSPDIMSAIVQYYTVYVVVGFYMKFLYKTFQK